MTLKERKRGGGQERGRGQKKGSGQENKQGSGYKAGEWGINGTAKKARGGKDFQGQTTVNI